MQAQESSKSGLAGAWWRLVRFGFRLLYNEMAFTYDAVSWIVSLGEWRSWQRAALKHLNVLPGEVVLEIAHGTGNMQIDLRTAGLQSVGLDFSPYMGSIASRKLTRHRIAFRLAQARAQALPFPDNSFPAVLSTFPTEFIVDPATLAEVYRVLEPGGRLVFVPSGVLTRGGLARQALDFAYRVTGQADPSEKPGQTGQYSPWSAQIRERFERAGFTLSQAVEPCRISLAQVIIAEKPQHAA